MAAREEENIAAHCYHSSGKFVEFTFEDVETSIPQRFEKIVQRYPNRLAVKAGSRPLTYAELNQRANRVAHAIIERRGLCEEPIAILCDDQIHQIAAILGVLKAGKFYVPLDARYPAERNKYFFQDSTAAIMLCDGQGLKNACAMETKTEHLLRIDDLDTTSAPSMPRVPLSQQAMACIMYTSGSTGEPKGILVMQKHILFNTMCYTNKIHLCTDDRLTLLHSLSFRISDMNLYGALLNGAALFIYDVRHKTVSHFAQWISDEKITIYHSVPTLFRLLTTDLANQEKLNSVRLVHLSGAEVTMRDLELWKRHFSDTSSFLHGMGTTETQTVCWRFIGRSTKVPGTKLPLGWPPDGKQVLILDENGNTLEPNRVGQVALQSRYISLGYWNKPELTKSRFLPVDGSDEQIYLTGDSGYYTEDFGLIHLGRDDFQIKIRGHRIETTEIEKELAKHDGVKESVVIGRDIRSGEGQLIAYVVPVEKPGPENHELREFLKARLPDYMIPTSFVMLNVMPLTANGKIDRKALPDPGISRSQLDTLYEAPGTSVEEKLVKIWAEVLDIGAVGIHDDFIELGGHSLLATRIIAKVNEVFGVELSMRSLLDVPTVAGLAKLVTALTESRKNAQGGAGAAAKDEEAGEL